MWIALSEIGAISKPEIVASETGYYYFELMLRTFPVFLNAVVNPLLYLLRMKGYQKWIQQTLKSVSVARNTTTASDQGNVTNVHTSG